MKGMYAAAAATGGGGGDRVGVKLLSNVGIGVWQSAPPVRRMLVGM
jgi:hypothetical protein